MGRFRNFLFRKRAMFRGISFVAAVTIFTIITLVSCSGITRPCVTCGRELASDPFNAAEEVRWDGMGESSGATKEKARKERRGGRGEL